MSSVTYIELMVGALNKREVSIKKKPLQILKFLKSLNQYPLKQRILLKNLQKVTA